MENAQYEINSHLVEKWKGAIDVDGLPSIKDPWRRGALAQVIENTVSEMRAHRGFAPTSLLEDAPTNNFGGGQVQFQDPILITMLRRSMPNLMAYEVAGVQPMNGPTGLIFALRALYGDNAGNEAFYDEPNTAHSTVTGGANTLGDKHTGTLPGNSTTGTANLAEAGIYNYGDAMSTTQLEALGSSGNVAFPSDQVLCT